MADSEFQPPLDAIGPDQQAKDEGQGSPQKVPLAPDTPPSPVAKAYTHTCRPDKTPNWKIGLEFGAFILGVCFAVIYSLQLRAALAANNETRRSFKADERAWVVLRLIPLKSYVDPQLPMNEFRGAVKFGFAPKNVGKTIARDIRLRVDGVVNTDGKPSVFGPQALAPGDEADNSFVRPGTVLQDKFTGRIDYVDTFNVKHWTTFCYIILDNKGTTELCDKGNEEDTNPEE